MSITIDLSLRRGESMYSRTESREGQGPRFCERGLLRSRERKRAKEIRKRARAGRKSQTRAFEKGF